MSYPWYRFKLTFGDGYEVEWSATEIDPQYAMVEILNVANMPDTDLWELTGQHLGLKAIEYLHYDTFGMDPESDKILLEEAKKEAESEEAG